MMTQRFSFSSPVFFSGSLFCVFSHSFASRRSLYCTSNSTHNRSNRLTHISNPFPGTMSDNITTTMTSPTTSSSNQEDDQQGQQSATDDLAPSMAVDDTTPTRRRSSITESVRRLSLKILSIMPDSLHHHHHHDPDADVNNKTLLSLSLEQEQLSEMLQQLSPEEIEVAARASYVYLKGKSTEKKDYHAKQYCLRYLRSKKNVDKAVMKLKETLAFRQEIKVDGIRTVFDDDNDNENENDDGSSQPPEAEAEQAMAETEAAAAAAAAAAAFFKETLQRNLSSKHLYVQGYDRHGRSTFIFVPRNVKHHDAEWTIIEHVYTLERALACSKLQATTTTTTTTDGVGDCSSTMVEPVNAIVDFTGFATHHAPPMHIGKQFMTILRNRYVGCIHQIFLVNAPTAFLFLWSVLKHFVGKNTRDKIHFVNSSKKNGKCSNLLADYYDLDQAASWMLPGGTKNHELDIDEYLLKTPFHQAFDDARTANGDD
jgi:CRAL/TRIO domain